MDYVIQRQTLKAKNIGYLHENKNCNNITYYETIIFRFRACKFNAVYPAMRYE